VVINKREIEERSVAKRLRQRNDKFEALEWLKGSNPKSDRNLAEWPLARSVQFVQTLYKSGATEVLAVQFDRNPPYESINTLLIALPDTSTARLAVFALCNDQITKQGFDPAEDYGQTHIELWFS